MPNLYLSKLNHWHYNWVGVYKMTCSNDQAWLVKTFCFVFKWTLWVVSQTHFKSNHDYQKSFRNNARQRYYKEHRMFWDSDQINYKSSSCPFFFLSDPSPIIGNTCHWLTDSLLFSKLDWCDPGMWRRQLKICWSCNCCWWGSCWQQFVAYFEAGVWKA